MKKTAQTQNNTGSDILSMFFNELEIVKGNDRSLILVTHGFVELLLNTIIDVKCKQGKEKITANNRDYPHSVKLVLLHELNLLDKQLYQILDGFRKIRNRAAHEPLFKITDSDFSFLNPCLERFIQGESKYRPNNLHHFCHLLFDTIWNENLDILLPKFAPDLTSGRDKKLF
jgi:hypothetical protein